MTSSAAARPWFWLEALLAAAICAGGFALAVWLFHPGIATHDALAVYDQAHAGRFGDWQPPLLGVIWVWLEPWLGYGPRAIFLPTVAIYWLAILLVFLGLRASGAVSAWLAILVGFLPPTFFLTAIIWRDVIFSVLWLLAFAIMLCAAPWRGPARLAALALALATFLIGFWLRPNALFAAVPMLLYLLWPERWAWRRFLLLAVPICLVLQGSAYAVNYLWLKAREDHVVQSIFVFDLNGITHFSGQNAFPLQWTPDEFRQLRDNCYDPAYWDAIWWPNCTFAMAKVNAEGGPQGKLFGSTRLRDAWIAAILAHPLAYLEHRFTHFWALLWRENMVMFDQSTSGQFRFWFFKSPAYSRVESASLWMNRETPVFRGLTWLVLSLLTGVAGLRLAEGRARAAVLSLSVGSVIYTLTYLPFGVAAEYRYVYWSALASLVAGVIVLAKWEAGRHAERA